MLENTRSYDLKMNCEKEERNGINDEILEFPCKELLPPGLYRMLIASWEDMGIQATPDGPRRKIAFAFDTVQLADSNGRPFRLNKWLNFSNHADANLTKLRVAVHGKGLTAEQLKALNIKLELIGKEIGCQILHREREGRPFASIDSFVPLETI